MTHVLLQTRFVRLRLIDKTHASLIVKDISKLVVSWNTDIMQQPKATRSKPTNVVAKYVFTSENCCWLRIKSWTFIFFYPFSTQRDGVLVESVVGTNIPLSKCVESNRKTLALWRARVMCIFCLITTWVDKTDLHSTYLIEYETSFIGTTNILRCKSYE